MLRELSTEPQWKLIEGVKAVAAGDERILAAWVAGSFATGEADAYSDVDVHCLVSDDSAEWFRDNWPETAAAMAGPLVLATSLPGLIGGYALTKDWQHLDLILHPCGLADPRLTDDGLPLYDSTGDLLPAEQAAPRPHAGEPFFPDAAVTLCLYFLGNLVVTFGRNELTVAHSGINAIRDGLVQVMLAERGVRRRGGNKRLNPYLSAEQRTFLESIPAADVSEEGITATIRVLSREFIRRGRALAGRTGATWPEELEDATIAHLQRHLGVDFRS
ncbi:hypothetical protein SAMN05421678_11187 [Actinopolymorpha cephalotaxi]|uniref:Streptomycin adenylyltransferase n=1 Tax=Actinopolymorpha cephalotaxi TaxID=504797 RepID=A0A1I2WVS9_9ACTN|nr:nucleotidyltransferase domain-containing protein [Actinopolymorpha cephalotaxi]NYH85116.1 hypothetical protein [Actinopolymorpha cephalotaxi]SFH04486.1 hypothetical protein SAMN05421678_11187 [Actinopolymorpha cephalotaxi]